ncbi:MAG: PEGA domain-containing protein [Patescibacteria group bacterium]|nr:PEGA domain-containing protein [Patescibacteria group bacterium]
MKNSNKEQFNKPIEDAAKAAYGDDIHLDKTFLKNLDKLVENTVQAKKLENERRDHIAGLGKKRSFLGMFFRGVKWQIAMLSSFLAIFMVGGVAYAAVPSIRNAVNEILVPTGGTVSVNSVPEGAEVLLKGEEYTEYASVGKTPYVKKLQEGKYEMRVTLKGYEVYDTSFTLNSGKSQSFEISLVAKESVLDKIKEWKTYVDLENGFEFTYPLSWVLEEDKAQEKLSVSVTSEKSYFKIYQSADEPSKELEKFDIGGKQYTGWVNYSGYQYTAIDRISAQKNSEFFNVKFGTVEEEEFEIYEFILASVKIYALGEDSSAAQDWLIFARTNYGFSLRYPQKDWLVVEREASENLAEFSILAQGNDNSVVTVVYSLGFWNGFNDYTYSQDEEINSYKTRKYVSSDGRTLYEFPNRLFLIKEAGLNPEEEEVADKIIGSFRVTGKVQYQEIFDYTLDYSVVLPEGWSYATSVDDEPFGGAVFASIENHNGSIRIYSWEDVEVSLDGYLESLLSDNINYNTYPIRIADTDYTKHELWQSLDNGRYLLIKTLFNHYQEGSYENWDNKVRIGERDYLVIIDAEVEASDFSKIEGENKKLLLQAEAVVSSLRPINTD